MRLRHVGLLAALATVAAFAACTLNPQPLPPRDDFNGESTSADGGVRSDSGAFGSSPQVPGPEDAASGTPNADAEGGSDDAGDGGSGDAGDAATDADGG
jgi:hypothetical protein